MERRTFFTILIVLFIHCCARAQVCDGQRYIDNLFTVQTDFGVVYGEAVQPTLFNPNATTTLRLDTYEPQGDTLAARPLIIWAFGGGFVFGSRLSPDIVTLCNEFTRKGYVNASIDYRLSTNLFLNSGTTNAYQAVMKASHDMAAAIRFFYKDAATTNQYRIDTNRIYVGGVSAGAFAALHVAHLDELAEIPTSIYNTFISNGGLAGNSGNAGYSQKVAGVISLCGALGDSTWIDSVDIPVVSMHGTNDNVVPYGTDVVTLLGINLPVDGSASIHAKLDEIGTRNAFYTFYGAGHTPFVADNNYMDTTVQFVGDFLYNELCSVNSNTTAIEEEVPGSFQIFPNPSNGRAQLNLHLPKSDWYTVRITNLMGQELHHKLLDLPKGKQQVVLDFTSLAQGLYYITLQNQDISWTQQFVKQ